MGAALGPVGVVRPAFGRWPQPVWRVAVAAAMLVLAAAAAPRDGTGARQAGQPGAGRQVAAQVEQREQAAVALMMRAIDTLAGERTRRGPRINRRYDPLGTGLIGEEWTVITTSLGSLSAKRTTVNARWAGVLARLLSELGLQPGDVVAAGFSGSFPALNVAVLAAAETLEVHLVAVASLGASMWGANHLQWTWLDMEKTLYERGVIHQRSVAYSLGGNEDRGRGLAPEGRQALLALARRHGVRLLLPESLEDAVHQRLSLVEREAARRSRPLRAYVNVGGNEASLGRCVAILNVKPGLVWPRDVPACVGEGEVPGMISHMGRRGVPVIHLLNIRALALRYGIPIDTLPSR